MSRHNADSRAERAKALARTQRNVGDTRTLDQLRQASPPPSCSVGTRVRTSRMRQRWSPPRAGHRGTDHERPQLRVRRVRADLGGCCAGTDDQPARCAVLPWPRPTAHPTVHYVQSPGLARNSGSPGRRPPGRRSAGRRPADRRPRNRDNLTRHTRARGPPEPPLRTRRLKWIPPPGTSTTAYSAPAIWTSSGTPTSPLPNASSSTSPRLIDGLVVRLGGSRVHRTNRLHRPRGITDSPNGWLSGASTPIRG